MMTRSSMVAATLVLTLGSATALSQVGAVIGAAERAAVRTETRAAVRAQEQAALNRATQTVERTIVKEEIRAATPVVTSKSVMQSATEGAARVRAAEDAWNAAVQANNRAMENRLLQERLNQNALMTARRQSVPQLPPPKPASTLPGTGASQRSGVKTDMKAALAARDELRLSLGKTTGSARDAVGAAVRQAEERLAARAATVQKPSRAVKEQVGPVSSTRGPLSARFDDVKNPSVIYQRFDPVTKEIVEQNYAGRSADTFRFVQRQKAHDAKLGKSHVYRVIDVANGRDAARVAEESAIRKAGGKNALANKRQEMNEESYRRNGGLVPLP